MLSERQLAKITAATDPATMRQTVTTLLEDLSTDETRTALSALLGLINTIWPDSPGQAQASSTTIGDTTMTDTHQTDPIRNLTVERDSAG